MSQSLETAFLDAYKNLNTAQKSAVDTLDGPVMVVAGPGTGKTQVLALRIANILSKTDTAASSILCLTFTRSGVSAMRARLEGYIGVRARDVRITTFHSFAIGLVEKYYHLLDFSSSPKLLDDTEAIVLVDQLLQEGSWEYLRPRTDPSKYFRDLRGLISILKRERMSPTQFLIEVEKDIKFLQDDPSSISSRGESKGQLKKEIEKKIDSLNRTREVVSFYEQYENLKHENGFMDYDDVLEFGVQLAEQFEDVRADLRENHQYVLVDEHQDSSGVQNQFLKAVWSDVERPDLFVVGDDRQLIYGFSGANLDYFTDFKTAFGKAAMITLTENYRSTAPILNLADELLKSSVTNESLNSNRAGTELVNLSSFHYNRDEIIGAGLYFKSVIEGGISADECALLLPKNRHVKAATATLRGLGLPVISEQNVSLLETAETQSLLRVLGIITNPFDTVLLTQALLDKTSLVPPMQAHKFLKSIKKMDNLSIDDLVNYGADDGLFAGEHAIAVFGNKLKSWIYLLSHNDVNYVVGFVGNELLIDQSTGHDELLKSIEIVRSFIHAGTNWALKNPTGNLQDFLDYFKRLNNYGNTVEIARLGNRSGIRVMTLHKSKGLEYDHVWIGHMNEEILMSEKASAFTLPESVKEKMAERDILTAKRELYVAITRAKKICTISYANKRDDGVELNLSHIVEDLSDEHFIKTTADDNESAILDNNPRNYASKPNSSVDDDILENIKEFVTERFTETKISVSMLNNFFECPWKWYFRNFLKLPETKGVSLALGSAVHSTIEYILKSSSLPSESDIKIYLEKQLSDEGVHDKKEHNRLSKDGMAAVNTWISGYYENLARDRVAERSLTYRDKQFPNLIMYGKIDLTERFPDGTITVTDFKTGSSKTTGVIEKLDDENRLSGMMRQLAMYSYLIRGSEGNDVTESRLLFLEEDLKQRNALYRTHVNGEQIELLIRDITDYQELLVSGEWMNRPCYAKPYGKSTECEYCARINKILGK
jgi:DNA helicase-2/ATP-dependent DNA helicase PcrA